MSHVAASTTVRAIPLIASPCRRSCIPLSAVYPFWVLNEGLDPTGTNARPRNKASRYSACVGLTMAMIVSSRIFTSSQRDQFSM
jgi:hypothetical protein